MLLPKKISQSRKTILIAVLVVILLIMGYLIYANFLAGMLTGLIGGSAAPAEDLVFEDFSAPAVDANFMTDFIKKEPYVNLKDSTVPVVVDRLGRINPFEVINFTGGSTR